MSLPHPLSTDTFTFTFHSQNWTSKPRRRRPRFAKCSHCPSINEISLTCCSVTRSFSRERESHVKHAQHAALDLDDVRVVSCVKLSVMWFFTGFVYVLKTVTYRRGRNCDQWNCAGAAAILFDLYWKLHTFRNYFHDQGKRAVLRHRTRQTTVVIYFLSSVCFSDTDCHHRVAVSTNLRYHYTDTLMWECEPRTGSMSGVTGRYLNVLLVGFQRWQHWCCPSSRFFCLHLIWLILNIKIIQILQIFSHSKH